jgi:large conductance mechanosensitive channel protein
MKKMFKEFKEFAVRGNVIDMAVGIIIGGAFGKIVSSVVSDIIMPAVGVLIGGVDFKDLKFVLKDAVAESPEVAISYGNFIQVTVDFIIIAFAVFLFIKVINSVKKKEEQAPTTPPPTPEDIKLLQEIRDLLKK